jgi:hypothetical protein
MGRVIPSSRRTPGSQDEKSGTFVQGGLHSPRCHFLAEIPAFAGMTVWKRASRQDRGAFRCCA